MLRFGKILKKINIFKMNSSRISFVNCKPHPLEFITQLDTSISSFAQSGTSLKHLNKVKSTCRLLYLV